MSTLLSRGLALCALLTLLLAPDAEAQRWRADGAYYVKPQAGINTYSGDRTSGFLSGAAGPNSGVEFGYTQRVGGLSGDLGAYLLGGRYPAVAVIRSENTPVQNELEQWRFSLGLIGRLGVAPDARLNPYAQLGVGTTLGVVNQGLKAAFSPLVGVGLDLALTDQIGLFTEASAILSIPDRQLDSAAGLDGQPTDWFGVANVGVRIGLNAPFTPVRVMTVDGPTRLQSGEEAVFMAVANEEDASGPVTYRWSFGDGTEGEGATVRHRFETPGIYTLRLTGRSGESADEQLLTVTVTQTENLASTENAATAAPTADEAVPADEEEADEEETVVRFSDTSADEASSAARQPADEAGRPPARPEAEPLTCSDMVDLNATHFEKDAATLNERGRTALEENAAILMDTCPEMGVRLEAYATADEADGAALGQARARTVRQFYLTRGVEANRIATADAAVTEGNTSKMQGAAALRRTDTVPVRAADASEKTPAAEQIGRTASLKPLPPAL